MKNTTSSKLKTSALQRHCYENKKRSSRLREGSGGEEREEKGRYRYVDFYTEYTKIVTIEKEVDKQLNKNKWSLTNKWVNELILHEMRYMDGKYAHEKMFSITSY